MWTGPATIATPTQLQLMNVTLNKIQDYFGTGFTYSPTNITGGTITSATSTTGGTTDFTVTGCSVSAPTLLASANAQAYQALMFAGNDTFNGSVGNDVLISYAGNDTINGNAGNDICYGDAGNDYINGGIGADRGVGGLGNDTYVVDNAGDTVVEVAGEGTDTVISAISYALGVNVENLTLSGTALIATGNSLNNVLTGDAQNNTLNGGLGVDTMRGGLGNDTYVVDNAGDVVTEAVGQGTDTVQSAINYVLGANIENLTLAGTALAGTGNALNNALTGNALANTLTGAAGNDTLNGGAGADTMNGGLGNDTYIVDNAADVLVEGLNQGVDTVRSGVNWTLGADFENLILTGTALTGTGNALNNVLTGNALANVLTGAAGNDTLDGGAGADTMNGGLGNDIYYVDNVADIVVDGLNQGVDQVYASVNYTLGANVENLTLTGTAVSGTGNALNNVLTGNAQANTLTGGGGNDTLNGGVGADTMDGGAGNDTYVVDNAGDVIVEGLNGGTDAILLTGNLGAAFVYAMGAEVENLSMDLAASGDGIQITGNASNNIIDLSNNTLALTESIDGGAGADTMTGSLADTTYYVDNVGDVIVEASLVGGVDSVISSVDFSLATNINLENLTLTGTAINATGNGANNVIVGNASNNVINGGGGIDTMTGGLGSDTFVFDTALTPFLFNTITDFTAGTDFIQLSSVATNVNPVGPLFGGLTAGALQAAEFVSAAGMPAATAATAQILYDSTTGIVYYDSDGTGVNAATAFVQLTGVPALTAADFVVV